jgi:hypothetical protein
MRVVAAENLSVLAGRLEEDGDSAEVILVRYVNTLGMGYEGPTGLFLLSARDVLLAALRLNPGMARDWVRLGWLEWRLSDSGGAEIDTEAAVRAAQAARCGRALAMLLGEPEVTASADSLLQRATRD